MPLVDIAWVTDIDDTIETCFDRHHVVSKYLHGDPSLEPHYQVPAIRYNAVYGYHYGWPEIALYRIRKDGVNVLIQIWN